MPGLVPVLVLLWERAWCTSSEPQASMPGDKCEPLWEGGPEDRRGVLAPLHVAFWRHGR